MWGLNTAILSGQIQCSLSSQFHAIFQANSMLSFKLISRHLSGQFQCYLSSHLTFDRARSSRFNYKLRFQSTELTFDRAQSSRLQYIFNFRAQSSRLIGHAARDSTTNSNFRAPSSHSIGHKAHNYNTNSISEHRAHVQSGTQLTIPAFNLFNIKI